MGRAGEAGGAGLAKPVGQYASVSAWAEGLRAQWGGDPLAEDPGKLATLESFCGFTGRDPDALVAFCFLRRKETGERFASKKRRAELLADLARFQESSGLRGTEARRVRSRIVSFLSHNGVMV